MDVREQIRALLPECLLTDRRWIESRLDELTLSPPAGKPLSLVLSRLLARAEEAAERQRRRLVNWPRVSYPAELPITGKREEILDALKNHQVVVVAGETGSGKTTQIPKMCLEAGFGVNGRIGCTQPRRVAALSISRRVAEELNAAWGREVGCKIRFSDQSGPESLIKFMTDGILLAETQGDPELWEYEALIIDEAHERSLNIDFLLGHLKGLLTKRPELKLVITSATIDTQAFSNAFGGAPIIEVSGRLFPVEVRYAPLDADSEETGDLTYIDAAVQAVEAAVRESPRGDILVFMPGERDIREARDLLQGRFGGNAEIIPLFGRLSAGDQQRVFAPSGFRKIIVATNIAETSLTIPGIRYVIDTGLARISRYNPRTRTKRLPVEPISQSSANQRKGRSGRVQNGVCIRLYGEEDFESRPAYTQPEIQRANLAEVILRMKAFHLGEIETFPFVDPPKPAAIQSGYKLLQELGALDEKRSLTALGNDLARLPLDPTIGRMILESLREGAVEEVSLIAAGLSIQDPRDRPLDNKEAADQAHKQFAHPGSDFLTLLNIWNAYHDQWDSFKTQNQMRKFCKQHFLSYSRMREWRDIYAQIREAVRDLKTAGPGRRNSTPPAGQGIERFPDRRSSNAAPPSDADVTGGTGDSAARFSAIHRAILSGLLGQIGQRVESNLYRAQGNRQMMIFPGSGLFDKNGKKTAREKEPRRGEQRTAGAARQAEWIMAGEIMETNRLYARMVAGIDPRWVLLVGAHLCKFSYSDPNWNEQSGRVLVRERVTMHGFEVANRKVDYGRINPEEATAIFIRSALVESDELNSPFLTHNRQVREKVEVCQTRMRQNDFPNLERALFQFYARKIQNVSSVHDLNRFVREHGNDFLHLSEADLIGGKNLEVDLEAFPDQARIGDQLVSLSYAYAPGEERDGVTVKLPVQLAQAVSPAALNWLVPGFRQEQIASLLRALPKALRRELIPIPDKAREIAASWQPGEREGFIESLGHFMRKRYGIEIPVSSWNLDSLPEYLRPRIEITGREEKLLASGRDLEALRRDLEKHETDVEQEAWSRVAQQWERFGLTDWNFDDPPARIVVAQAGGAPLYAYPGLQIEDGEVCLRLFRKPEQARDPAGVRRLAELALGRDLAWLEKDLRALEALKPLYVTLGPAEEMTETAFIHLKRHLFQLDQLPSTRKEFQALIEQARGRVPGLADRFTRLLGDILKLRQQLQLCRKPYPGMPADLNLLLPRRFLETTPPGRLPHLPRYLKAMLVRAERAALNPGKDKERARQIEPFQATLARLLKEPGPGGPSKALEFRWMLEEFKVSLFAQELGTSQPVSAKRLENFLSEP